MVVQHKNMEAAIKAACVAVSLAASSLALSACSSNPKDGGTSLFSSSGGGTTAELAQAYFDCLLEAYYFNGSGSAAINKAIKACEKSGERYAAKLVSNAGNSYISQNVDRHTYPLVRRKGRRYLKQTVAG